jgi:hypothetical protein
MLYLTVSFINSEVEVWRNYDEIERFARLMLILVSGITAYFIALWVSGIRAKDLRN